MHVSHCYCEGCAWARCEPAFGKAFWYWETQAHRTRNKDIFDEENAKDQSEVRVRWLVSIGYRLQALM